MRVASIVVSDEDEIEDELIWGKDRTRMFLVGSAYRACSGRSTQEEWLGWGRIRKLAVQ